ncbi:GNAT family N-acetyltransferase [Actinotalea sp. K2]|uniref:GNAT family N-acetyltransferase n=1 Tax=Actinotalea sp. K2 TaxID=2939438 RepID=UPI002016FC7D|nr:GNAT family N-acetyltransferase [Actinotalea sp. K2]MCL3862423.1 GNAT family N-acetyltransferase [Actinotalea sp. K2]
MMDAVTVTQLGEVEWSVLREIRLEALDDAPAGLVSPRERERGFREIHWRMRLRSGTWFVASADGAPCGLISVLAEPGGAPDDRHLIGLWVRPTSRRQGLGRQLVSAAESWARGEGARTVSAWLDQDDAAGSGLLQDLGYAPTGVTMAMPRDPHRTEARWERLLDVGDEGGPGDVRS